MAASHCISYHPHPAAALRHNQFQCKKEGVVESEFYQYYDKPAEEYPVNIDYRNFEKRACPAYPSDLLLPPPPYYRGRDSASDSSALPPLPETPVEGEDSLLYPDEVFGNHSIAGDRRPIRHGFDSDSEVFFRRKLGSDSSGSVAPSSVAKSITIRENRRTIDVPPRVPFHESNIDMGSGGSVISGNLPIPEQYPLEKHSTKQKPREILSLSEKRDKSGGGMRKKIRNSLDKLNLRAFPWGSTDKLSSSSSSSVASKSKKSTKGGIRRYSDSNTPASINSITSVLTKVRGNRDCSPAVRPNSSSSYNDVLSVRKTEGNSVVSKGWKQSGKLIKTHVGGTKESQSKNKKGELGARHAAANFSSPINPNAINQGKQDHRTARKTLLADGSAMLPCKTEGNLYTDHADHAVRDPRSYDNRSYQTLNSETGRDFSSANSEYPVLNGNGQDQYENYPENDRRYFTVRGRNPNCNLPAPPDICKAKGTWSLLRNISNSPRRVGLASNPTSSYNSPFGSTETLLSSSGQSRSKSTNKILDSKNEGAVFVKPAPPDITMIPPPKLTPVSGKLLIDKNSCPTSIVRPTAFKAVVPAMKKISPPAEHGRSTIHCDAPEITVTTEIYDCNSSLNTDSGRNSTSSINGTNVKTGSCYSASEGYESARVSSSTAHDQHSDRGSDSGGPTSTTISSPKITFHPSTEDSSIRSPPDDVMIRDLESKVRERENDILQLQKSLEENEKTLSRVYEERDEVNMEASNTYQNRTTMQIEERGAGSPGISHSEVTSTTSVGEAEEDSESLDSFPAQQRLEECRWTLQQKCGEISLLKRLLRESQADVNRRSAEVAAQRSINRDLREQWLARDKEASQLLEKLKSRDFEIIELERRLHRSPNSSTPHSRSSSCSSAAPGNNNITLISPPQSPTVERVHNHLNGKSAKNKLRSYPDVVETNNNGHAELVQSHLLLQAEVETLRRKLNSADERTKFQQEKFDRERAKWNEEKSKVIRYQKKLQNGYVEIHKRSQELEEKVESLTEELEMERARKGSESLKKGSPRSHELRFPTDI